MRRRDWCRSTAGGIELLEGEYTERLVAADPEETVALPSGSGLVVLDTAVTPELADEGVARDLVRVVQHARRDAGLVVSDRIALRVGAPDAVLAAVRTHEEFVAAEVLAATVAYGAIAGGFAGTVGDGVAVQVAARRLRSRTPVDLGGRTSAQLVNEVRDDTAG